MCIQRCTWHLPFIPEVIKLLITIVGQISKFKSKYATGVRHSVDFGHWVCLANISIAFCSLSNTFVRPIISMLSNKGGLTF